VHVNNRNSHIGGSNSKMKPDQGNNASPENDVFKGAGAANTASDSKNDGEFGASAEFEKHFYFRQTCVNIRRLINVTGAFAALLNVALDIVYAYKISFQLKIMYILMCVFLAVRIVFTLGFGQYYYSKYVRNYRVNLRGLAEEKFADDAEPQADERNKSTSRKQSEIRNHGQTLYSSLHLLYYTGFYRILPSSDFKYELAVGYSMELFLTTIPMLFCQLFNNSSTEGKLKGIQSAALLMKLFSLSILIVELFMLIWEVKKNYEMKKLGIGRKKLTEEERRTKYAKRLSFVAFGSMILFLVIIIAGSASNKSREC
jgi:hypothetical protein